MPRSVKHGGKKVYRFKNMKNAVTARKKAYKKKRHAQIACKEVASEWDASKTTKKNLEELGLTYDVNKLIPLKQGNRRGIDKLVDVEEMDLSEARDAGTIDEQRKKLAEKEAELLKKRAHIKEGKHDAPKKGKAVKAKAVGKEAEVPKSTRVHAALEAAAASEAAEQSKGRAYKLLDRDVEFCIYMLEKHGEDYEAMARDRRNIFQDTPKQLARKMRVYKQSPYYKAISLGETTEQ